MMDVLHIERSLSFRKVVKDAVTDIGGRCRSTGNGSEALSMLEQSPANLIITGMELQDTRGDKLIKELNSSRYKDIPVIIISSTDSLELRKSFFSLGVIDFIPKGDITFKAIKRYLNAYLEDIELHEVIKNLSIAVVDDSKASLQVIRNIFNLNKVNGVEYYSNTAPLLTQEKIFDIYILDMILPEISGRELILHLRERAPNSVILAVSSIGDYKSIANVLMLGANDYLIKPFNASIFISRLKSNVRTMLIYKELEATKNRLKKLAERDGLTELYNHNTILEHLDRILELHEAGNILLFDVDNFKAVNDTWGHQTGDRVLKALADTLRDNFDSNHLIGRFGGEEFLVISSEKDRKTSLSSLQQLLTKIREINIGVNELSITLSGGAAFFDGCSANDLIRTADRRLYLAKSTGKNRVFISDTEVIE